MNTRGLVLLQQCNVFKYRHKMMAIFYNGMRAGGGRLFFFGGSNVKGWASEFLLL